MKIIMAIVINGYLLISSLNYFDQKKMIQGEYLFTEPYQLEELDRENADLKINLLEGVSEKFISEYLENQFEIKNYLLSKNYNDIDTSQIRNYLSKFFAFEIENFTNKNLSISNDLGLPIIQEARDKNGEWKPIEYILLHGSIFYGTIKLQSQSKIEIAAPRYGGNYETELRVKVAIQGYGTLISPIFNGRINYSQFKMPKVKGMKSRIYFIE